MSSCWVLELQYMNLEGHTNIQFITDPHQPPRNLLTENPHGSRPFCVLLSAGGNCNMVLVTNIYGEATQLEETVRKDSQFYQVWTPSLWVAGLGKAGSGLAQLAP